MTEINGTGNRDGSEDEPLDGERAADDEGADDPNEEVARLAQELADHKDRHLRALAEMDNMRRRLERERVDLIKYGLEGFMRDLLPVLDSLEKALPGDGTAQTLAGSQDPKSAQSEVSYLSGMVMVKKQMLDVLHKHGLEPVKAAGQAFDPNLHQAIQRVESEDVAVDTVKDEFARGYTLHGRLLRPAMVSVLTPAG
jgi:molecular chaperone GrpE